jgi:hypothetical protein
MKLFEIPIFSRPRTPLVEFTRRDPVKLMKSSRPKINALSKDVIAARLQKIMGKAAPSTPASARPAPVTNKPVAVLRKPAAPVSTPGIAKQPVAAKKPSTGFYERLIALSGRERISFLRAHRPELEMERMREADSSGKFEVRKTAGGSIVQRSKACKTPPPSVETYRTPGGSVVRRMKS